jgi:hypothetical protein
VLVRSFLKPALETVTVNVILEELLELGRGILDGPFALSGSVNHRGSTGNIKSGYRLAGWNPNEVIRVRDLLR